MELTLPCNHSFDSGILNVSDEVPAILSALIVLSEKPYDFDKRSNMVSGLWTIKALKLTGTSSDIFRMPQSQK